MGRALDLALIPPERMARIDAAAIKAGVPGEVLMARAGRAVVRAITARFTPQPVLVLAGPGNNGGDGYVVARRLANAGWPVRLAGLVPVERLRGDASNAAKGYAGPTLPLDTALQAEEGLVVDALFGAGLARPVEGTAKAVLERFAGRGARLIAVDVPSGVDGADGSVRGFAAAAALTVTFCRLKPGHVLLPGRGLCGETVLADIGIPDAAVAAHDTDWRQNRPALWRERLAEPDASAHKYTRGHALIVGGPVATTGAARMAAAAALRAGAGLVSVACDPDALPVYAAGLTAVMTKPVNDDAALLDLLQSAKVRACLIGPGADPDAATKARVLALLGAGVPLVLDGGALTAFAAKPDDLTAKLRPDCVLTPHDGEYARLFAHEGSRLERARHAAKAANVVVVLKGSDTCVAAPDGRATVNGDAPPSLATAGSGDVLAGIVTALLARGLPAFEAASAAVWLHAAAARARGPHLVASDLESGLPAAFKRASG